LCSASYKVIDFLEYFAQEHGASVREQCLWSPRPTHNLLFDKDFGHGHSLGIGDCIDLRPLCQAAGKRLPRCVLSQCLVATLMQHHEAARSASAFRWWPGGSQARWQL